MYLYLYFPGFATIETEKSVRTSKKKPQCETIEGWFEVEGNKVFKCSCDEGFHQPELTNSPETIKREPILEYYSDMGRWFYGAQEVTKFAIVQEV